jgi:chemotaxis protein methyltransferase CheR
MDLQAPPDTFAATDGDVALERLEIELLLEAIHRQYALDFRGYAWASLRRRLWHRAIGEGLGTLSGLQERILHDPAALQRLLLDLSINVTSMFRDPPFFAAFRETVVPLLRTYPFIRIWNAGCSTGEEVYSLAILLTEAGLYDRTRIYATDFNETVLERARAGIFPLERMREYTANYIQAGGTDSFSSYYRVHRDGAHLDRELSRNIVFAQHNLVSDGSFNEFNAILCRNVMIYFARALQRRVHDLFHESLVTFGVLGLGSKESIRFSGREDEYETLDESCRLYRRLS